MTALHHLPDDTVVYIPEIGECTLGRLRLIAPEVDDSGPFDDDVEPTGYRWEAIVDDTTFSGFRMIFQGHRQTYEYRCTKGWRWHPLVSREDLAGMMGESVDYLKGLERAARFTHVCFAEAARDVDAKRKALEDKFRAELDRVLDRKDEIRAIGRAEALERWRQRNPVDPDEVPECLSDVPHPKRLDVELPCVVYFLLHGGEVVYVGQSTRRWPKRIREHLRDGVKEFDDVWFIETDIDSVSQLEDHYIRRFQPKYNVIGVPQDLGEVG